MHKEKGETLASETAESPEYQKKEMKEGTEEHIISEDFQRQCMDMTSNLSKAQIDYLQQCCSRRHSELNSKDEFSDTDMPS